MFPQRGGIVLAAIAVLAIAAWPGFARLYRPSPAPPYVAPVQSDYLRRDETIAFYERRVQADSRDQISAVLLAGQYMQRYREAGDVGDILRALHQALRSLRLQPQNNAAALMLAASAYTALHRFRDAIHYEEMAHRERPDDSNAPAQLASLAMEVGEYTRADRDLAVAEAIRNTPTVMAVRARYEELTGRLDRARSLLRAAIEQSDAVYDNPAQSRAWYHFRLGEIAFSAGDVAEAKQDERDAIAQFPGYETAHRALARFCWATAEWTCARDEAEKAAQIVPTPEALGYETDAQRALGQSADAAQTNALIGAIERIGNAYHLNDRLLAVYYAEHRMRLDDALQIARREVRVRGPEIYAQDTLAWAAAMDGHWNEAQRAASKAILYDTADPRIQFHAGVIAYHFGHFDSAGARLRRALDLNPQFDPFYASIARHLLEQAQARSRESHQAFELHYY